MRLLFVLVTLFFYACASCQNLSIQTKQDMRYLELLEQLSQTCELNLIISSKSVYKKLQEPIYYLNTHQRSLDELLHMLLPQLNLFYSLERNTLHISYLQTKSYTLDYLSSKRMGKSQTTITLSSASEEGLNNAISNTLSSGIDSSDYMDIWEQLQDELFSILNRQGDSFKTKKPIINKKAGIITVTATYKQLKRLEFYLKKLHHKLTSQVLIDVKLLSVSLNNEHTSGIDWEQIYSLQNVNVQSAYLQSSGVSSFSVNSTITGTSNNNANLFSVSGSTTFTEVIKFLQTQGRVTTVSNPKILTLNNQPALISVGNELFYKTTQSTTTGTGDSKEESKSERINSVFQGVLLDITPQIASNNIITLRINPSVSELLSNIIPTDMPPNLSKRQLSSVIQVQDTHTVVLGGLINKNLSFENAKVPLIAEIPFLGSLFKREGKNIQTSELVILITAHILDTTSTELKMLQYQELHNNMIQKLFSKEVHHAN